MPGSDSRHFPATCQPAQVAGPDIPPPLPDYRGGSIANLIDNLARHCGAPGNGLPCCTLLDSATMDGCDTIVLLVIDGLGDRWFQQQGSVLAANRLGRLTSVFPSTTAAAIGCFITGQPPSRHGLTGWHVHLGDMGVCAVLPLQHRAAPTTAAERDRLLEQVRQPPLADALTHEVIHLSPADIARSPFNRAHGGKARILPYQNRNDLFSTLSHLLRRPTSQRRFIYAYYPQLDHLAHHHGINSEACRKEWQALEAALAALPKSAAQRLLVTADHGFADLSEDGTLWLDAFPAVRRELAAPLSGEWRATWCHVRPGRHHAFEVAMRRDMGHAIRLYRSRDVIKAGWLGPAPYHPQLRQRTGDYLLLATGQWALRDRLPGEHPYRHLGVHGGLSEEELYVPLLLL